MTSLPPLTDLAGAEALRRLIGDADVIVAMTGAGISTESGVPDFRSPGSPWMVNKPVPFEAFMASEGVRREAWRRKFAMDDHYRHARPNRGHAALARLVAQGRMPALITQNIDNLHQASGIPAEQVIELHGNGSYAACQLCGRRHELADIRPAFEATGEPPRCVACEGPVKSATVSFGQPMPGGPLQRAVALARQSDLFLVLGSSLVVQPAATLPLLAQQAGARLVIVNREPTPLDRAADLVLRDDIGALLEATVLRH